MRVVMTAPTARKPVPRESCMHQMASCLNVAIDKALVRMLGARMQVGREESGVASCGKSSPIRCVLIGQMMTVVMAEQTISKAAPQESCMHEEKVRFYISTRRNRIEAKGYATQRCQTQGTDEGPGAIS
jgi:hypothetical protein